MSKLASKCYFGIPYRYGLSVQYEYPNVCCDHDAYPAVRLIMSALHIHLLKYLLFLKACLCCTNSVIVQTIDPNIVDSLNDVSRGFVCVSASR